MKILLCGSRGWKNEDLIRKHLTDLARQDPFATVIEGGGKGADQTGRRIARSLGLNVITYWANWKAFGKGAGPARNQKMVDQKPDVVLAFWDGQSPGTKDTLDRARKAGIKRIIVNPDDPIEAPEASTCGVCGTEVRYIEDSEGRTRIQPHCPDCHSVEFPPKEFWPEVEDQSMGNLYCHHCGHAGPICAGVKAL